MIELSPLTRQHVRTLFGAGDVSAAIALANLDWRDLLVAAGFADDIHAHARWRPREK